MCACVRACARAFARVTFLIGCVFLFGLARLVIIVVRVCIACSSQVDGFHERLVKGAMAFNFNESARAWRQFFGLVFADVPRSPLHAQWRNIYVEAVQRAYLANVEHIGDDDWVTTDHVHLLQAEYEIYEYAPVNAAVSSPSLCSPDTPPHGLLVSPNPSHGSDSAAGPSVPSGPSEPPAANPKEREDGHQEATVIEATATAATLESQGLESLSPLEEEVVPNDPNVPISESEINVEVAAAPMSETSPQEAAVPLSKNVADSADLDVDMPKAPECSNQPVVTEQQEEIRGTQEQAQHASSSAEPFLPMEPKTGWCPKPKPPASLVPPEPVSASVSPEQMPAESSDKRVVAPPKSGPRIWRRVAREDVDGFTYLEKSRVDAAAAAADQEVVDIDSDDGNNSTNLPHAKKRPFDPVQRSVKMSVAKSKASIAAAASAAAAARQRLWDTLSAKNPKQEATSSSSSSSRPLPPLRVAYPKPSAPPLPPDDDLCRPCEAPPKKQPKPPFSNPPARLLQQAKPRHPDDQDLTADHAALHKTAREFGGICGRCWKVFYPSESVFYNSESEGSDAAVPAG